jgi:hypothetical protein
MFAAFSIMAKSGAGALLVGTGPLLFSRRNQLAAIVHALGNPMFR